MTTRLHLLTFASIACACGDDGGGATTSGDATTEVTTAGSTGGATTSSTDPDATAGGVTTTTPEPTTAGPTGGTTDDGTTGTGDGTTGDATTDPGDDGTSTGGDTSTGADEPVCGDGVVEPGETCDDGSGIGCATYHDGGDGVCVPEDECSAGYVLAMGACVAELVAEHVHIEVSNTCEMQVTPSEFSVLPGQKLRLVYHNHSVDYPVDVWMHYNGGFLDLAPGQSWMEQYEHCFGPNPSEGWADISTACSEYKLPIHCL